MSRFTPEIIADMQRRYGKGASLRALAAEHDVCAQYIHKLVGPVRKRVEHAWTAEEDARVSVMWDEGKTTSEIGLDIGVSKNAIIGRARRIGLKPRPSPITGAVVWTLERRNTLQQHVEAGRGDTEIGKLMGMTAHAIYNQRKLRGFTRPAHVKLTNQPARVRTPSAPRPRPVAAAKPVLRAPVVRPVVPVVMIPARKASKPSLECQFITTADRPYAFCGNEIMAVGKPYCHFHWRLCHVQPVEAVAA